MRHACCATLASVCRAGGAAGGPARIEDGDPGDDGFLMTSGLKNASKCRDCSKTLDVGTPAWYVHDSPRAPLCTPFFEGRDVGMYAA